LNCDLLIEEFNDLKRKGGKKSASESPQKKQRASSPSKTPVKATPQKNKLQFDPVDLTEEYVKEKELPLDKTELEHWDDQIEKVLAVTKEKPTGLIAFVLWTDGTKSRHPIKTANKKFPQQVQ
jgi:hypothetical protein